MFVPFLKEAIFYKIIYNLINQLLLYNDVKLVGSIKHFLLKSMLVYCHWILK